MEIAGLGAWKAFHGEQGKYFLVKKKMLDQYKKHGDGIYKDAKISKVLTNKSKFPTFNYWFDTLGAPQIASDKYKVPIIIMTSGGSNTLYLPLIMDDYNSTFPVILYLEDDHFYLNEKVEECIWSPSAHCML
ncbi:unnamed protein product [Rhizopus stolonifer]